MGSAIYTSQTGLESSQTQLDVSANNLANSSTNAFKSSSVNFEDLLYSNLSDGDGALNAQGTAGAGAGQIGSGVAVSATPISFAEGPLQSTGNPMDVAIVGNGLFTVLLPGGTVGYTRNGSLQVDAQGRLETSDGDLLYPPITLPAGSTSVQIGANGVVTALTPSSPNVPVQVGQLTLANFTNPDGLLQVGSTTFTQTAASGPPSIATPGQNGLGALQSGELEESNVNVTTELANLIIAQRTFSFNSDALQAGNTILTDTLGLIPLAS